MNVTTHLSTLSKLLDWSSIAGSKHLLNITALWYIITIYKNFLAFFTNFGLNLPVETDPPNVMWLHTSSSNEHPEVWCDRCYNSWTYSNGKGPEVLEVVGSLANHVEPDLSLESSEKGCSGVAVRLKFASRMSLSKSLAYQQTDLVCFSPVKNCCWDHLGNLEIETEIINRQSGHHTEWNNSATKRTNHQPNQEKLEHDSIHGGRQ